MPSKLNNPVLINFKAKLDSQDYQGAISTLENAKELPKNIKYFNLGYVHYKMGQLVEAKKYYELAKINGMYSKELFKTLDKLNSELAISSVEDQYSYFENFLFSFKTLPSTHYFLGASLIACIFLIGVVKKWVPLIIASLSLVIALGYYQYTLANYQFEYVEKEELLHRGPSVIFEEIGVLPAGAKILISKERNHWRYIEYPRVFQGWINIKEVEGQL